MILGMAEGLGREERREIETGRRLHEGLPDHWKEAARDREEAQALIFGLLLAEDDELRQAGGLLSEENRPGRKRKFWR